MTTETKERRTNIVLETQTRLEEFPFVRIIKDTNRELYNVELGRVPSSIFSGSFLDGDGRSQGVLYQFPVMVGRGEAYSAFKDLSRERTRRSA